MTTATENPRQAKPIREIVGLAIWIVVHVWVAQRTFTGGGYLPFGFAFYAALSWVIAAPVIAIGVKASDAKKRLLVLWFIGPFIAIVYAKAGAAYARHKFESDMAYLRELCDKHGGETIYRTVDNVQGIFQINLPNPNWDAAMQDRNAENPWGVMQGDRADMGAYATPEIGYRFIEQQPAYNVKGPPFRRTYLKCVKNKRVDDPRCGLRQLELSVNSLRSQYGYEIVDRTTPEMRSRWIGGGTIRILDMRTNELLAERTGFYKGLGGGAKLHWGDSRPSETACKYAFGFLPFLKRVLRPVDAFPTAEELEPLAED